MNPDSPRAVRAYGGRVMTLTQLAMTAWSALDEELAADVVGASGAAPADVVRLSQLPRPRSADETSAHGVSPVRRRPDSDVRCRAAVVEGV
jgi:hypothetical protein